jgi:hypothetical protein
VRAHSGRGTVGGVSLHGDCIPRWGCCGPLKLNNSTSEHAGGNDAVFEHFEAHLGIGAAVNFEFADDFAGEFDAAQPLAMMMFWARAPIVIGAGEPGSV